MPLPPPPPPIGGPDMVCLVYARMAYTPRILWYYRLGLPLYGLVAPSVEPLDRWMTRKPIPLTLALVTDTSLIGKLS